MITIFEVKHKLQKFKSHVDDVFNQHGIEDHPRAVKNELKEDIDTIVQEVLVTEN